MELLVIALKQASYLLDVLIGSCLTPFISPYELKKCCVHSLFLLCETKMKLHPLSHCDYISTRY